jgi:hypothetical protein
MRRRDTLATLPTAKAKGSDMDRAPRTFISYSHDSDEHRERVLALSERLRQDGIETILDRYVKGSPPEGWPRWMLNGLDSADRVLPICTPTYYRRFRGQEAPGQGKGVDWKGAVITLELYHAKSRSTRFIPVVFDPADQDSIPEPIRGLTWYCPTSESAYRDLYDALLDQAGVEPGVIGTLQRKSRDRGQPLRFDDSNVAGTHGPRVAPSGALAIWQEKLDFLLEQQAVAADPAQKFQLRKQIDECRAKIRELGGDA